MALGITDLRRPPDVVGRVGRPADPGKWLAAVVVGGTAAGKTMGGPPVQQAAAVGVPAAYRVEPLQEALLGRLTTRRLPTRSPAARHQGDDERPGPHLASHEGLSSYSAGRKATWVQRVS